MKASPEHQCHHIKESGERCGSPHMKKKPFCYFHMKLNEDFSLPGQPQYEAPALDNLHAVALALTHVQRAQAKKLISPLEAKAMTYTINSARDTLRMIQNSTPICPDPANIETEFTPGMRHLLWLDEEEAIEKENEERDNGSRSPECGTGCPHPVDRCEAPAPDQPAGTDADTTIPADTTNSADFCHPERASAREAPLPNQQPASTYPDPPYETWTFEQLSTKWRMSDYAAYFGYTPTGEKLPPAPPAPDPEALARRRPHPLQDAIGLRPWGKYLKLGEVPRWIPVSMEELAKMEAVGMPRLHEPHTKQQTHNARRLRISQCLRDREKSTTTELLSVIAKIEQELIQLAPFIEQDRREWLAQKAAKEAENRA